MPGWSKRSQKVLLTLHPLLRDLMERVNDGIDISLLEGYRDRAAQEAAFNAGTSDKHFPYSMHNRNPSEAVDLASTPIKWDPVRFYFLQGYVKACAEQMGIAIRQGIDWDRDGDFGDQGLIDGPHVELVGLGVKSGKTRRERCLPFPKPKGGSWGSARTIPVTPEANAPTRKRPGNTPTARKRTSPKRKASRRKSTA